GATAARAGRVRRPRRARHGRIATHRRGNLAYAHRRGASDAEMTTADQKVERAANKLQRFANELAGEGGVKAKLAEPLAEDADFIRKLKPSLFQTRARGA